MIGTPEDGNAMQNGFVPSKAWVVPAGEAQGCVLDEMMATRSLAAAISAQYDNMPVNTYQGAALAQELYFQKVSSRQAWRRLLT